MCVAVQRALASHVGEATSSGHNPATEGIVTNRNNFGKAVELKRGTEVDSRTSLCQHTHSSSRLLSKYFE